MGRFYAYYAKNRTMILVKASKDTSSFCIASTSPDGEVCELEGKGVWGTHVAVFWSFTYSILK
ncbi:hypothetical protein EBT31_09520 [bacterium]|nr:hypothetical protein [bacterium]